MKNTLKVLAILAISSLTCFTSCKKVYDNTYLTKDTTIMVRPLQDTSYTDKAGYPLNIDFNRNQTITIPFTDSIVNNITLSFTDSVAGTQIDIITYVNSPIMITISLGYASNCYVGLIGAGTFAAANTSGGYYDIQIIYKGQYANASNFVTWQIFQIP